MKIVALKLLKEGFKYNLGLRHFVRKIIYLGPTIKSIKIVD